MWPTICREGYAYLSAIMPPPRNELKRAAILANVCQRFRTDYPLATRYLQVATDYARTEGRMQASRRTC